MTKRLATKITKIVKQFEIDTQKVRAELIEQLKQLVTQCLEKTQRKRKGRPAKKNVKNQQIWIRTAAYV